MLHEDKMRLNVLVMSPPGGEAKSLPPRLTVLGSDPFVDAQIEVLDASTIGEALKLWEGADLILLDFSLLQGIGQDLSSEWSTMAALKPLVLLVQGSDVERIPPSLSNVARDFIVWDKSTFEHLRFALRSIAMRRRSLGGPSSVESPRSVDFRLCGLLQSHPDPILVLGDARDVLFCNPAARTVFDGFLDQAIETSLGLLDAGENTGTFVVDAERSKARYRVRLVISEWGTGKAHFAFFIDETEVLSLGQDIQKLERELDWARRLSAIGELASGLAHEINNPLMIIAGYAEALIPSTNFTRNELETLKTIRDACWRCVEIVKKFLSVAQRRNLGIEEVQLNEVVQESCLFLERQFLLRDIRIQTRLSPDLPPIAVNHLELHEILANLLINARDAMPDGGTIIIRTMIADELVRLEIRDTGIGIPPEHVHKIFEPFFTTKSAERGTGLGLALVKSIIDRIGGLITLESTPGSGSRFEILFPIQTGPSTLVESQPALLPLKRRLRILIVDDEPVICELCSGFLRAEGHEIKSAGDGQQALDLLKIEPFDLILMDLRMPHYNGHKALEALAAVNRRIPVVIMSGSLDPPLDRIKSLGLSLLGVLRKPFRKSELSQLMWRIGAPLLRVLIADDDEVVHRTLSLGLNATDLPLELHHARDGYEAGRFIEQFSPDVILLDIFMPGIDGFDICRDVKSRTRTKQILVVAITASSDPEVTTKVKQAGADYALTKPVDIGQVEEIIRSKVLTEDRSTPVSNSRNSVE